MACCKDWAPSPPKVTVIWTRGQTRPARERLRRVLGERRRVDGAEEQKVVGVQVARKAHVLVDHLLAPRADALAHQLRDPRLEHDVHRPAQQCLQLAARRAHDRELRIGSRRYGMEVDATVWKSTPRGGSRRYGMEVDATGGSQRHGVEVMEVAVSGLEVDDSGSEVDFRNW